MTLDVKFEEQSQTFNANFGEVQTASDGGFERGYEEGYKDGYKNGFEEPKYLNDLSKYIKIIEKPTSAVQFRIDNPLGGIARKVTVKCVEGSNASTDNGVIRYYTADKDATVGGMRLLNATTGNNTVFGVTLTANATSNSQFAFQDGLIILRAYNNTSAKWDTESDYEVEIYQ